jgi:hypothetical protein
MRHGRTTTVKIRAKLGHWARSRPKEDNPHGVPTEIMRQLASESLPDKESYSRRLNELMKENSNG